METLYNAPLLMRFHIRRDRVMIPVWVLSIIGMSVLFAPLVTEMFTGADGAAFAETMKSPAMAAICGKSYGEALTGGSIYAQTMLVWTMLVAAAMNIFLVLRHTRKDEEEGRFEVVGSLPVGRSSNLFSVTELLVLVNLVVSLGAGLGLAALGLADMGLAGSLLFGFSLGISGLWFAGCTAVFAQLSATSKGTLGFSLGALGVAYLLRAAGDTGTEALALISPLGLPLRTQMYVNDYVWPLIILLAEAAALFAGAFLLAKGRDLGAGILAARKGRAHARAGLSSAYGLYARLLRPALIAWAAVAFVFSASYGSVFKDMENIYKSGGIYAQLIGAGYSTDNLLGPIIAMLMTVMSIIGVIPVIVIMLKPAAEEKRGRGEQILSKAVSRSKTFVQLFVLAAAFSVVIALLNAVGMWSAAAATMDKAVDAKFFFGAALVNVPAFICFAGVTALLVGLAPRLRMLTWLLLGWTFLAVYLGGILNLPDWMLKTTPFGFVPNYPVGDVEPLPLIGLTAAGIALFAIGMVCYGRRDIKEN
jgi:ABC-2 type transport system permease protein